MVIKSTGGIGQDETRQSDAGGHVTLSRLNVTVDRRLTAGRIPGVTVDVKHRDSPVVNCAVRAIGSQEIVIIAANAAGHPAAGDLITFSLCEGDTQLLAEQSGIAHWDRMEGDTRIVALFSGGRLDLLLDHRLLDERRMDIRYPVDLQALVKVGTGHLAARVVNYSLHGLCLLSDASLELNRVYQADMICDNGPIRLLIVPQWISTTADSHLIGCGLTSQYGMLLTCRHTAKAILR